MKQLAKEQWKDEWRCKEIKEMGKLVEMQRRYNVENEETHSAVKKPFPAKKLRKSLNTQKAAGTFSDTGRRQALARGCCWKGEGNHRCLWGKQKGCTASWKTKATLLKKNTPTTVSQCFGSDKKGQTAKPNRSKEIFLPRRRRKKSNGT